MSRSGRLARGRGPCLGVGSMGTPIGEGPERFQKGGAKQTQGAPTPSIPLQSYPDGTPDRVT